MKYFKEPNYTKLADEALTKLINPRNSYHVSIRILENYFKDMYNNGFDDALSDKGKK